MCDIQQERKKSPHCIPPLFCSQRGNKDLESRAGELVKLRSRGGGGDRRAALPDKG